MTNPFKRIGQFFAAVYSAAERDRHFREFRTGAQTPRSEDQAVGSMDRSRIRQRCLDLRRNNPIVAALVQRFSDNVVGAEIMPQARTKDKDWNNLAEAYWREWAKVADARQRVTFQELTRLVVESRIVTGDLGMVLTDGGQLQPIEGERILTPREYESDPSVVEGIRVDPKQNIPVGFYVFSRDKDGKLDSNSKAFKYVLRENFVHINNTIRLDHVRGLPDLTPAVDMLRHLDELQLATLEKAKLDAMNAWFIPSPNGGVNIAGRRGYGGDSVGKSRYEQFESGRNYYGSPGEEPKSLASTTPNAQYDPFVRNTLRAIGGCLGIPYEFLILDFSSGSYASQRVGLIQTYRRFQSFQLWLTNRFLQRVWNWRIAKAILAGELPQAPIDERGISTWYKVDWIYPQFDWSDPHREAQSQLMEYRMGVNTVSMMSKGKGRDPEDMLGEKAKDIALADQIAKELKKTNPDLELTWRDLIEVAGIPANIAPPPQLENK